MLGNTNWRAIRLYLLLLAVAGLALGYGCSGGDNGRYDPNNPLPRMWLMAYPASGPAPLTVTLDGSGSWAADGSDLTLDWDFNDDGTYDTLDGEMTFEHTFTDVGQQVIRLRATDSSGNQDTITTKVDVAPGTDGGTDGNDDGNGGTTDLTPVVKFRVYPTSGVAPHEVYLDASASWAREGTIASYEYDVDGDGTYDINSNEHTLMHTYHEAGEYTPGLRVTDSAGRSATATGDKVTVTAPPPNEAPHAVLVAQPVYGEAPLTVNFDGSSSWDNDGTITSYDWDFDGDGSYELANSGAKPGTRDFDGGNHTVGLRVTDDDGASSEATVSINVTGSAANRAPTASLSATPLSGSAPLTVNFDATASSDPDGDTLQYRFDYDGDGTAEDVQSSGNASHVYAAAGTFSAKVTVRDPDGLEDSATVSITVSGGTGNQPPQAQLSASPTSGEAPLEVSFDASSSTDPDNNIERYLFDFDGDGTVDLDTATATASHTYAASGTYNAKVTVRDAQGAEDSAIVAIKVENGDEPDNYPVAIVTADPAYGRPPVTVKFYAGLSLSIGSAIRSFDWDLNNDGTFELIDAGPEQTVTFATEGTFYVTVRVTDYNDRQSTGQGIVIVSNLF